MADDYENLEARVGDLETAVESIQTTLSQIATQLSTLSSEVAEIAGESEYSSIHSGENIDSAVTKVLALTQTAAEMNSVVSKYKNVATAYSSSVLNNLIAKINSMPTAANVTTAVNNTFPLVIQRYTYTFNYSVNSGSTTWYNQTIQNMIPANMTSGYSVLLSCDWGGASTSQTQGGFAFGHVMYSVSGRDLNLKIRMYHEDGETRSGTANIYIVVIGKRSGGGYIG